VAHPFCDTSAVVTSYDVGLPHVRFTTLSLRKFSIQNKHSSLKPRVLKSQIILRWLNLGLISDKNMLITSRVRPFTSLQALHAKFLEPEVLKTLGVHQFRRMAPIHQRYMAVSGGLWGPKRCGSKPPLTTSTITCLYKVQYKSSTWQQNSMLSQITKGKSEEKSVKTTIILSLEEKMRKLWRGFVMPKWPNSLLVEAISLFLIPRRNQLMKEGLVVGK
jgi:hypothetical protein